MQKIKKEDQVIVLTGKDRGRPGRVLQILVKKNSALVEGLNKVKKHTKPNPQKSIEGGIVQREAPIHLSNLALYNPRTQKGEKVGIRILENGRRIRYFKSDGEPVDL